VFNANYPVNIENSVNEVDKPEAINGQFKMLVESIITHIFVVQQGKYVYVNPSFEEITGYSAEDLYRMKSGWEIVDPQYQQLIKEMPLNRRQERHPNLEIKILNKDGEVRWIACNGAEIDYEGKPAILGSGIDITDRKQSEEALRRSEKKYRNLIDNSHDIIYTLTPEGVFTFVSSGWTMLLGHPVDQVMGKPFQPFVHPDDIAGCQSFLQKTIETGQRQSGVEYRVLHVDGSWSWHTTNAMPLRDETGVIIGLEGNAKDITERKQAEEELQAANEEMEATLEELIAIEEELRNQYQQLQKHEQALRDSEQRLADIINFLPDPTIVIDKEGQVTVWNQAGEELTGVKTMDILGKGNYEYALPFYGARRPILIDQVLFPKEETGKQYNSLYRDKETITAETDLPVVHGESRFFSGKASPLYDTRGNLVGAIESMRDMTDRKAIEKALEEEKELLKTTLLSIGDGVISTDEQGKIHLFNKVAEQLTGWTQEEVIGKSLEEVFEISNEFTRERCISPVREVLETGKTVEIANHTMLISKDGIEIPIEDSAAPIKDENGKINGVVLVFRDYSEKKERQEKIAYLSYHDYLTGLYNRRFFEEELKRLDTERNLPITLVMADVNGLKLTNDAFGHAVGDKLLSKVAEVMKKECRTDDIIARVGGDEFVFLLPNTDTEEAKIIVKRINGTLAREKIDSIIPSVSFGCATKHAAADEMSNVSKQAEDNMYRRKLSESSSMRNRIIKVIISTLYEKNKREEQHSQRVSELCAAIGTALDISAADLGELRTGGLLHDIGKITLDEKILNKPGELNNSEWLELKRHSETGYRILSSVNEFSQIAEYVLAHHERWDGEGYPKGLKGAEIPYQARIMGLADAYDAMTCDRPYRKALSEEIVITEIKSNAGKQFDPVIARVFVEKVLGNKW